jgi:ATP-dependent 26S proteasome regulatory subunit
MANGKLLRQLIKSGTQGDAASFRSASEAVIKEEREKNHHLLANDLERLLYGDQANLGNSPRKLHLAADLPTNKDNGLALLEARAVVREEKDIVLSDTTQSALGEILMEHNRADVLRSFGLKPAQKLLFCGPPGCGKTLAAEVIAHSLSLPPCTCSPRFGDLVISRRDSIQSAKDLRLRSAESCCCAFR